MSSLKDALAKNVHDKMSDNEIVSIVDSFSDMGAKDEKIKNYDEILDIF
jgi:hypothetical protein